MEQEQEHLSNTDCDGANTGHVALIVGGLPLANDVLVDAALAGFGYHGVSVLLFEPRARGLCRVTRDGHQLLVTPLLVSAIVHALLAGDVLRTIARRLRPYELEPGAVDRALADARSLCREALLHRRSTWRALRKASRIFARTTADGVIPDDGRSFDLPLRTIWLLRAIGEMRRAAATPHARGPVGLWATEMALRGAFVLFARGAGLRGWYLPGMDEVAAVAESDQG